MEEEKNKGISWIKAHKKQLVFAGISIGVLILAILAAKNIDEIKGILDSIKDTITSKELNLKATKDSETIVITSDLITTSRKTYSAPFDVTDHIRNLPEGQLASPKKLAEAESLNILLLPGQTIVDKYTKGANVA